MKTYKVIFNSKTKNDLQQAINYYNQETGNNKLSNRFLEVINKSIIALKESPLIYQIRYDNVRCMPTPSFPFLIHYRVEDQENLIKVEAILHTSLNPAKWKERS